MANRRTKEGMRLRVYMDALTEVQAMSSEDWIDNWAMHADADSIFITRSQWIEYLNQCIIREAAKFANYSYPLVVEAA